MCRCKSSSPFPKRVERCNICSDIFHRSRKSNKCNNNNNQPPPTPLSFLLNKTLCCNLHLKYCRKYLFKNTKKTQEQNFLINPRKPFELCIFILVLSCVPPSPLSLISILLSYCICIVFSCLFLSSCHTFLTQASPIPIRAFS